MKVIKDGRSTNKPVQIKCLKCTSVLEVTPADIKQKHYDQRDGNANAYQFRCAVCGHGIYVTMNQTGWCGV